MDLDLWIRLLQHGEFLGLPETLAAFRIGQESLSADNEATIYAEQKAYIEELGTTPHLQVRRSDIAHGADARAPGPGAAPGAVPDVPHRGPPGRASGPRDGRHLTLQAPDLLSHIFCS